MKRENSTVEGVYGAFADWISDHPISFPEIVVEGIEKATKAWLDFHEDEILAAIAKAIKIPPSE